MTSIQSIQDFYKLVEHLEVPPSSWKKEKAALWWDAKGNWEKAHELVDSLTSPTAAWIHAYLHRKEGDQWNAEYWYRQACKPVPDKSLQEEFEELVIALMIS
jgi:hypothetical protein